MSRLRRRARRKAIEATVHHATHGIEAKVRRQPIRSTRLLALGAALGCAVGWIAGRKTA